MNVPLLVNPRAGSSASLTQRSAAGGGGAASRRPPRAARGPRSGERLTRAGGFDSLSHFDVPVRTSVVAYGGYDPTRFEDCIRPVLKNCIERGIALDLNTAALRRRAKTLTPGLQILRWYAEMGGERLTLGSDAHKPEQVASHLEDALAIARAAGLKYVTQFEQRQAHLISIL